MVKPVIVLLVAVLDGKVVVQFFGMLVIVSVPLDSVVLVVGTLVTMMLVIVPVMLVIVLRSMGR